jgi:hypothetical protein
MELIEPCERFGTTNDSVSELKDIIRKYGFLATLQYVKKHIGDQDKNARIQMYNHFSFYIHNLYQKLKSGEIEEDPDKEEVITYEITHDKLKRIFHYMIENPSYFNTNLLLTYKKMSIVNRELDIFTDNEFLQKLDDILGFSFNDLISFRNLKSPKDIMKLSKMDQKKLTKMVQNITANKLNIPSDSIISCEISMISPDNINNPFFIENQEVSTPSSKTERQSSNENHHEYKYSLDETWLENELEIRIQKRLSARNKV